MTPRHWLAIALLAIGGVTAAGRPAEAAPAAAVDPFYLDQLHDGLLSYDRGEFPLAAKRLRVACFGLLDDPTALAGCLTRLATAQAAASDQESFRDTFRRIVELEDRFGAYSKADLPPEVRAAFEQRVVVNVPATTLEAIPAFSELLRRKIEAQVATLPPRERRQRIEEQVAKLPKSVAWNLELARLDLEEGKTAAALARAEQVVTLAPQDPPALCLRGLARAAAGRCVEALVDLDPCGLAARDARYAAALLRCRINLGQWRQADEQLRALPAALKADKQLAAMAQEVNRHQGAVAAAPGGPGSAGDPARPAATANPASSANGTGSGTRSAAAAAPPAARGPTPAPPTARPVTPAPSATRGAAANAAAGTARPLTPAEHEAVARCERLLASSGSRDLKEALRLAHDLAEAHPEAREVQYLAGEASYRNSRWSDAVGYFRRGGTPDDERPEVLFYMAVSLYEMGDTAGAATALKRSLPNLQKTPYVDSYAKRILGQ